MWTRLLARADVLMQTPGRRLVGAEHVDAGGLPATPSLRSPIMSPLRRTGVRGAPQSTLR